MSESGPRRRGLLLSSLALASGSLAACGFQPVYGPDGGQNVAVGANEPALLDQMAAVRVGPIGERTGQLMRRALQRNLEGLRPGTPARYDLAASVSFQAEVLGYRRDGTPTRVRYVATAPGRKYLADPRCGAGSVEQSAVEQQRVHAAGRVPLQKLHDMPRNGRISLVRQAEGHQATAWAARRIGATHQR